MAELPAVPFYKGVMNGYTSRKTNSDGKQAWEKFKEDNKDLLGRPILGKWKDSILPEMFKSLFGNPNAFDDSTFPKDPREKWEMVHFINQLVRIPTSYEISATRVAQLGFNVGQALVFIESPKTCVLSSDDPIWKYAVIKNLFYDSLLNWSTYIVQ